MAQRAWSVALALTLSVSAVLAPSVASAEPTDPQAKAHLRNGLERFEAKDFAGAVDEFEAGYAIEPDPLFLFAWAQAEFNRGDCRRAVKLYSQFIDSDAAESAKTQAREGKMACAEMLANAAPDDDPLEDPILEPTDDPVHGGPGDPIADDPPRTQPRKWYLDPAGDSLVAIGSVLGSTGGGLLIGAQVLSGRESASIDDHDAKWVRIDRMRIAGGVILGVGGALLIAGAVRWGLIARKAKRTQVAALLGGGVTGLSLSGRF